MLNLNAISPRDLRAARAVVGLFDRKATAAEILSAINENLSRQEEEFSVEPRRCPSCGRGYLAPVFNSEGLTLEGCRRCRYSREVV